MAALVDGETRTRRNRLRGFQSDAHRQLVLFVTRLLGGVWIVEEGSLEGLRVILEKNMQLSIFNLFLIIIQLIPIGISKRIQLLYQEFDFVQFLGCRIIYLSNDSNFESDLTRFIEGTRN